MRAFNIGEKEATAVSNLQDRVPPEVTQWLREAVRPRGMRRWMSHDLISKNLFNKGFTSGTGLYGAWSEQLTNGKDDVVES